ncbi:DUF3435 containing protein [Pyrenophora tritici-repentis]|nr:DUF3435 containing protein [Pyrenophora tritici-repentis]
MPFSTKRIIRKELATSTGIKNAALMRNRYLLRRSNPSSAADSCWEGQSDTNSFSDTYSDPDTEADTDINIELSTGEDAGFTSEQELDADLDSEAEEILKDIAQLRAEGPAKPNHTPHTIKLWKREGDFWERYCSKIMKKTKRSPEEQLRACDPEAFKAYLRWRKKNSRVKKESSMRSYWKRLSMCYMDLTRHTMDADVLTDVCNWIPSLMLDKSEKEKHAMYVQDLYAILHALWVDDTKPLHGFIRVQISLLLLLSAATATRPGAIVESASAKGSNKALSFKNIELLKVRSVVDPSRSTIVANVNLENVKNKEKDGKPKKFTFRLEGTPAFCIVSYILSIGIGQGALRDEFSSVREIFDLNIPADRDVLRIKWKKELLNQPFLCDVRNTSEGVRILKEKAFPYAKYRDTFVRLGRVAGFEESLELYQLRRASGRNINSALDPVERNQTMGHLGSTYEKYYTPTHIARDFQSIYFGSPSEALLIESVARMGLSRDRRAPTELDDEQQKELRNDPALTILRKEREVYKEQLYNQGFYPLSKGEGTDLYKKYEETKRKIGSTYQRLYRERLESAVREFHESIDTIEIARQLSGMAAEKVLTLPAVEFELRERGTIAGMLFKPIQDEKARMASSLELIRYQPVLQDRRNTSGTDEPNVIDPMVEELRMSPLVWWNVKQHIEPQQQVQRGYAVLGHVPEADNSPQDDASVPNGATRTPVLLNTDSPWSAFLCGSQGSGKSHTLSCMLENCLLTDETILSRVGLNPHPLAGLVFHYDRCQGSGVCEAAYLCTSVPTTVLVSPSNYGRLKRAYEAMAEKQGANITVKQLYVLPKYLDTERMKTLMAVGKEDEMPLYMQTILMILRKMAIESQGLGAFDYNTFRDELSATKFASGQDGPMKLRLDLLESFMKRCKYSSSILANNENDFLAGTAGSLTIVDLTDPVIDADSACVLFDICLSVFIQQTQCGKIVALDEAHNYMA